MSNAWYEVLSVLHLMAMLSLSHANLLLLPRTSSDGYQPKVSEGDWWRWWADGFGGSMTAVVVVVESATINTTTTNGQTHQHPYKPTSITAKNSNPSTQIENSKLQLPHQHRKLKPTSIANPNS